MWKRMMIPVVILAGWIALTNAIGCDSPMSVVMRYIYPSGRNDGNSCINQQKIILQYTYLAAAWRRRWIREA
jgi:hypothetical protein